MRGTDGQGNPILVSGNHGPTVRESVYPKEKVMAYVMPPDYVLEEMARPRRAAAAIGKFSTAVIIERAYAAV